MSAHSSRQMQKHGIECQRPRAIQDDTSQRFFATRVLLTAQIAAERRMGGHTSGASERRNTSATWQRSRTCRRVAAVGCGQVVVPTDGDSHPSPKPSHKSDRCTTPTAVSSLPRPPHASHAGVCVRGTDFVPRTFFSGSSAFGTTAHVTQ